MISKKALLIFSIIAIAFVGFSIFVIYRSATKQTIDSTTQSTAPAYEGPPVVSIEDQTGGKLYNAIGGDNYINIKYFIGEYVSGNGVAMDPIPNIAISNFSIDVIPQADIGIYSNIYTFDAYIASLNKTITITINETTGSPTTASIVGVDYTRYLESYVEIEDTH